MKFKQKYAYGCLKYNLKRTLHSTQDNKKRMPKTNTLKQFLNV